MVKVRNVVEIGNLIKGQSWRSPQRGRVYGVMGISPCLSTMSGGGQPKILITDEDSETDKHNR